MELRSRSLDGSLRADAELTSRLQAERRDDLAQALQLLVEPVDVTLHLDDVPAELAEWPKRPAALLGHVRFRGGAPLPERAAQVARPEDAHHCGDAQPSTDPSVEHAFLLFRCACASWSCSRRAGTRPMGCGRAVPHRGPSRRNGPIGPGKPPRGLFFLA